jgi:hypothetical protein
MCFIITVARAVAITVAKVVENLVAVVAGLDQADFAVIFAAGYTTILR